MSDTDKELVALITAGEVARFAQVIERYDAAVRRFISRRIDDRASKQDLVQEVFYRALKNLPRLEDPDQLENWLVSIARNCVIDHYRKYGREREHRTGHDDRDCTGVAQMSAEPARDWIWDEVRELAAIHTQILELRYAKCFSYQQIADRLGLPLSTIRGRLYEARRLLRQRLERKGLFP